MADTEWAVDCDRFDRRLWRRLCAESPSLRQLAAEGSSVLPAFDLLLRDFFCTLFKTNPVLLPPTDLDPRARENRTILEQVMASESWRRLRETTVLRAEAAAAAAFQFGSALMKQLVEEGIRGRGPEPGGPGGGAGRVGPLGAARDAFRSCEAVREAVAAWGLEAEFGRMTVEERLALARRLMGAGLQRVSDLVGRYRRVVRGMARNAPRQALAVPGRVAPIRELTRLAPLELARLAHPAGRADVLRRWQEGQTLGYQRKRPQPVGMGPMVVLLDTSLSTSEVTPGGYQVRDWIAAVGVALAEAARLGRRRAAFVHFSGRETRPRAIEFAPGEWDVEKLLRVAETWYGLNTDYTVALEYALGLLSRPEYRQADVVMVTDAAWTGWRREFLERFWAAKRAFGFRLVAVAVRPVSLPVLDAVADCVFQVDPDDEGAAAVLEAARAVR